MSLGWNEIMLIMLIVLLLFGGKKIPELMRGLGRGVREFNDAKDNVRKEIHESINDSNRAEVNRSAEANHQTTSTTPTQQQP